MNVNANIAQNMVDLNAHYAAVLKRTRAAAKADPAKPIAKISQRPPVEQNAHVIEWLRHKLSEEQGRAIKLRMPTMFIIKRVLQDYPDVTFEDLIGPRRNKLIVRVRHLAIRALKAQRPDLSYPQIGKIFNRDHSTVLNAIKYSRAVL